METESIERAERDLQKDTLRSEENMIATLPASLHSHSLIEVHYMNKNPGMFPSKTFLFD